MTSGGNYFEDFRTGQILNHGPARTVSAGDAALYTALYGGRFAPQSSDVFARTLGMPSAPIDDLLVFHLIFGKTVPEVSLNAIANLGYAECRFLKPVFAGDTLSARSEVLGARENANRESGIVYVRSTGFNQRQEPVLSYARWAMVRKRANDADVPSGQAPKLAPAVEAHDLAIDGKARFASFDRAGTGGTLFFDDYAVGARIDHGDAMTVEDAEHMMATRLYHNTARVHFNAHAEKQGRFGRRIVYGGHVISIARALSFNGLANAWFVRGINAGRHVAPCFGGDTVYAWSEILGKAGPSGHDDFGYLRVRTVATKDRPCGDFPYKSGGDGNYDPAVILDLDYWALMPRA
jgi:2-methylfumaryl-CoA hydratase